MNDPIIQYYKSRLERFGDSPKAVDWRDELTQVNRFRILSSISSDMNSVLDVGCGLAHFYSFLRLKGFQGKYLGLDILKEFVDLSNRTVAKDPLAEVQFFDASLKAGNSISFPTGFEYGFVSGMFNNQRDNVECFMYDVIERLWEACEKGIAFNVLSKFVEYEDSELYYADPVKVFLFLKQELKAHVVMYHDYVLSPDGFPYEVTFHVRKEPLLAERLVRTSSD